MSDVADVAGVGRATLYRYFPNRQVLLAEVAEFAVVQVSERLQSARIDEVEVEEGVRRAVRAAVDVGDSFIVLARAQGQPGSRRLEGTIAGPIQRLFERGQSTSAIRGDVPSSWLTDLLVSHVVTALSAQPAFGHDDVIEMVTSLFLDGARAGAQMPSTRARASPQG